jgi:hypothetical protein
VSDSDLARRIEAIAAAHPGFDHRVRFDLGTDGALILDARTRPPAVTDAGSPDAPPPTEVDATLTVSAADLAALVDGTLSPTIAYMTGRLKVAGPLDIALKLGRMLGEE